MKEVQFFNIVPVFADNIDFTISEIIRQKEEVGIDHVLLSLSFHPQRTPAKELIPILTDRFVRVRDGIAGRGVKLGVLIQSIQGHGWNGKIPLTKEPWQHMITISGRESPRMCFMDPGFREYALECVRSIAEEKPSLILLDDDFGLRGGECFCPYHMAEYNAALGTSYSREELAALLKDCHWSDELSVKVGDIRLKSPVDFAKDVRATIDSVDPSLRCGVCACYAGHFQLKEVVKALAGNTRPLLRINDSVYGDEPTDMVNISFMGACRRSFVVKDVVEDIIDESDTFPHNYMSESAALFHSHISTALLHGFVGAKIWTAEYERPLHTGSQARYEEKLREYRGFYNKLCELAPHITWKGVSGLAFVPPPGIIAHPADAHLGLYNGNWETPIEGMYAFPIRYEGLDAPGISMLHGSDAKYFSDEQLRTLLKHTVVVDSIAAREITNRGMAKLIGVEADEGDCNFHFKSEFTEDREVSLGYMWNDTTSRLKVISDKAEILSWFSKSGEKDFPSSVIFENEEGGHVVVLGWSLDMIYHTMYRPKRRQLLLKLLDRLGGTPFEMAVESGDKMLVRHGVHDDGSEIVSVTLASFDILDSIPIRLVRNPKSVEMLTADGSWQEVGFSRTSDTEISIDAKLYICMPVILRFCF